MFKFQIFFKLNLQEENEKLKLIVKMMREEMENIASDPKQFILDTKENYDTNMKPTKGESQNTSPLVENKMFMNAKSG